MADTALDVAAKSAKDEERALLDRLPDDLTLEQNRYHGVFVKITRSEESTDREGWIAQEEVRRRINEWFAK